MYLSDDAEEQPSQLVVPDRLLCLFRVNLNAKAGKRRCMYVRVSLYAGTYMPSYFGYACVFCMHILYVCMYVLMYVCMYVCMYAQSVS